ncbi:c-type cytochrome [Modicisalibacter coralii]|uniref:c-type cytochrome n=1 Tax=Modicisalibacter coralii TaxID=2304602 RepID=UPI00100A5D2F|nr:cytochrome c [Halomonas coralii]
MKRMLSLLALASLTGGPATIAQADDIDDAIHYRHAAMEVIAWQMVPMSRMVKGDIDYDAEAFAERARRVADLAPLPWEGFIADSYDRQGTHALPDIAANRDDFDAKAQAFEDAAVQLAEVAGDGSFDTVRARFAEMARSCKACHDDYRAD